MNKNTLKFKKYSLISLILAGLLTLAAFFLSGWARAYTGALLFLASLNTFIFALLIYNEYRLRCKSELEEEEQESVRKSAGASKELFDDSDEALMLASRALKNWKKYILPAFTLIYGITSVSFLVYLWVSKWQQESIIDSKSKMAAAACAGALGVCYFLIAAFFSGASRQKGGVALRSFSAWAYLTSLICVALMTVLFFGDKAYPHFDYYANRTILTIFIFLAFELSINFLIDWYRPRFHKEEKSILESRFLAVFTDSGSIASNIAHALDYQFGLKVTDAGFYRFVKKTLLPLILLQLGTLYLLSSFTLIETGQRGIKETFGKIDSGVELSPGLHMTLPYPLTKIHVYPADKIMSVEVGLQPKKQSDGPPPEDEQGAVTVTEDIMLWKNSGHHTEGMEEIKYVISNKNVSATDKKVKTEYNLITVVVPIHFKIKTITEKEGAISPLYQFLFEHVDAKAMLKTIASEVVVTYLTRSDYFDFLGKNRVKAADDLKRLVQTEADRLNLGVEIVLIALEATHPPGEVAKSYDEVMAAEYERDKVVYEANVKSMNRISEANIMSGRIISDAKGKTALIEYNGEQVPMKKANAIERVKRLEVQLESFNAQPYLFSLINYLATIEDKMASTPKVIIDSSKTKTNFQIDLKPAILPDIGDLQEVLQREN